MQDLTGKDIGRYHIIEKLGQGGMAVVYRAFDTRLERDVALKFIRIEAFSPEVLERVLKRFEKEGKALGRFSHGNIVQVHDYGEYEGVPYLVMEYLPGGTLKSLTGKAVEWQEALRLLIPIARGLAYAHTEGVVHRDIKPSNILLSKFAEPKLADFGIARILEGDEGATLTGTGVGVGTPEYMAPEQGLGKEIDGRADVYALGVVLYELITGRKPYTADTPIAVIIKQVNDPLPKPGEYVADLPKEVEQVLYKALAKDPENRYENMTSFAAVMEKLLLMSQVSQNSTMLESKQSTQHKARPEPVPAHLDPEATRDDLVLENTKPEKVKPQKSSVRKPNLMQTLPWWGWVGGISGLIVLVVLVSFLLGSGKNNGLAFLASKTPTLTQTPLPTQTPIPTKTATPTITSSPTVTLTPTPTLGIGSTKISDKDQMEMVYVPAGSFMMGNESSEAYSDEKPVHEVYLDAYWIDKYEVTNAQYAAFLNAEGNGNTDGITWYDVNDSDAEISQQNENWEIDSGKADNPVIEVSWYGAQAYCEWAGRELPSEAQWEKAARGEDGRTYPWGEESPNANLLNYHQNVGTTTEVGSYPDGVSPYGVMDMAGNVWEWVNDWYDADYYTVSPEQNPTGPANGQERILRGGSWVSNEGSVRSSVRYWNNPDNANYLLGFRCAISD